MGAVRDPRGRAHDHRANEFLGKLPAARLSGAPARHRRELRRQRGRADDRHVGGATSRRARRVDARRGARSSWPTRRRSSARRPTSSASSPASGCRSRRSRICRTDAGSRMTESLGRRTLVSALAGAAAARRAEHAGRLRLGQLAGPPSDAVRRAARDGDFPRHRALSRRTHRRAAPGRDRRRRRRRGGSRKLLPARTGHGLLRDVRVVGARLDRAGVHQPLADDARRRAPQPAPAP